MGKVFLTEKQGKIRAFLKALLAETRKFLNSYIFYIFQTLAACVFVYFHEEVLGAVVFAFLICFQLVVCDDILPTTLPFLLISTFTTNCYDSFDTFIGYIVYAPIVLVCFVFHFIVYHKKYDVDKSVWGIFAVSIAILLGGVGNFTFMQYMRGAYYVFGLSFGMLVAYLLMRSQFNVPRAYDVKERFAAIMTLVGVLCVAMIAIGYYIEFVKGIVYVPIKNPHNFSRNNLSTMLMFAMPFPLFFTGKKGWLAIFTPIIFAALCLTGSRGGMLCGSLEFLVCCICWILCAKNRWRLVRFAVCAAAAVVVVILLWDAIVDLFTKRILNGIMFESERYTMIFEAFERFEKSPIVGSGLLDDTIAYGSANKKGTMAWYHMMIPQVIGSMGLIGIAAYGFQIVNRLQLIFKKRSWWSVCLGLSYLGILLMSQVNPGEFCPVPFEVLTVLLFIFQELRFRRYALWEKRV